MTTLDPATYLVIEHAHQVLITEAQTIRREENEAAGRGKPELARALDEAAVITEDAHRKLRAILVRPRR